MAAVPSIVIRLDPRVLVNPDLDLRYLLPDRLVERSSGAAVDDGYDLLPDGCMLLFLRTEALGYVLPIVLDVIEREDLLGTSLASAVVAVVGAGGADATVVYPPSYTGEFPLA